MLIEKDPFSTMKRYDGEYFLICNDKVFHLEGITSFIWSNMDDGTSFDKILNIVLDEYDVTEKKATKDLNKILKFLKKIGAINY